jgi:hypothetical protein
MEGNRTWAKQCGEEMPELLPKLATGQVGLFSYISCLGICLALQTSLGDMRNRTRVWVGTDE